MLVAFSVIKTASNRLVTAVITKQDCFSCSQLQVVPKVIQSRNAARNDADLHMVIRFAKKNSGTPDLPNPEPKFSTSLIQCHVNTYKIISQTERQCP